LFILNGWSFDDGAVESTVSKLTDNSSIARYVESVFYLIAHDRAIIQLFDENGLDTIGDRVGSKGIRYFWGSEVDESVREYIILIVVEVVEGICDIG
jgi:hypothetical protein